MKRIFRFALCFFGLGIFWVVASPFAGGFDEDSSEGSMDVHSARIESMSRDQIERLGDWYSGGEERAEATAKKSLRRWSLKQSTVGKFSENPLSGDLPFGLKNRIAFEVGGLGRWWVMTDHDPKEIRIFDLMKFSAEINAIPSFPQIVFGAIRMDLGQGLLYSTEKDFLTDPFSQIQHAGRQAGIRPDSGFREIHPVGVGLHFLIPHFRILGFGGKTSYDAKIAPSTSFGDFATVPNFSDLDLYHTNAASLQAKETLLEWVGCVGLEWFGETYRISVSGLGSRFSLPLGDVEHGEKLTQSLGGLSGSFLVGDERGRFFGEGVVQCVNPMEAASLLFIPSSNLNFAFRTGFSAVSLEGESRKDRTESLVGLRFFSPGFSPLHTRLEEGISSGQDEWGLTASLAKKWGSGDRLGLLFDLSSPVLPWINRISDKDPGVKTKIEMVGEKKIWKKIKYEVSLSGDLDAPKDGVFHAGLRNGLGLTLSNLVLRSSFFMKKDFGPPPLDWQIPWLWDNEGRLTFSFWECGLKVSVFDVGKDSGFSRFESLHAMDTAPVYLQGRGLRFASRLGFHFANAWQLGFGGVFDVRENAAVRFSLSMFFQTEWGG